MAHYINDYFELWDQYGDLKKRVSKLEAQLHVAKVVATHLMQEATVEKKRRLQAEEKKKALNGELVEALHKLSEVEA